MSSPLSLKKKHLKVELPRWLLGRDWVGRGFSGRSLERVVGGLVGEVPEGVLRGCCGDCSRALGWLLSTGRVHRGSGGRLKLLKAS